MLLATMVYSIDLQQRVVASVEEGGRNAEATRRFCVSGWCVQNWCGRSDLVPKQHGPGQPKLDRLALRQHVAHHPAATLKERAQHVGVAINAIWYALQRIQVTHKKSPLC